MEAKKSVIDRLSIERNTESAKRYMLSVINKAKDVATDPRRADRINNQECTPCFYLASGLGGSRLTTKPCGICEAEISFGNTCTDVLCSACAKKNDLCKRCGGDIKLENRELDTAVIY